MKVTKMLVRPVAAPMRRPLATSSGKLTESALLLLDLQTDQGIVGRSYLFGIGKHNLAPIAKLVEAMAAMLHGDALAPFDIEKKLRARYALLGVHNIVLFAMAGIDLAAWDALGQSLGQPLVRLLGGAPRPIPAYNSKGLGILSLKELEKEAVELVEEGFRAVKLRLGRPEAKDDLEALRAVKKAIGPGVALMVDFNQALSVAEAMKRGRMIDEEGGVLWIEEPVRADDFAGSARIAREIATPIQIGENFMGPEQMAQALAAGMEMSSHLFPEASCHLLAVTPTSHWLEFVDWADPILQEPLAVKSGLVHIPEKPGLGIMWNEEAVRRYTI